MSTITECEENQDELARLRALTGVERALWELAMNILDVARGAGKPLLLGPQARALVNTIDDHRSIAGYAPSTAELANVLDIAAVPVVLASLQVAATSLADYRSQTTAEPEAAKPTGYGDLGYRPETQTTEYAG